MANENKKRKNFIRLANSRMSLLMRHFERVSNLSNRRYYQYDKEELKKMYKAIEYEVKEMKKRFDKQLGNKKRFDILDNKEPKIKTKITKEN